MTTPRIYLPPELCVGETLEITAENYHYLARVLRVRVGETVEVLDGVGTRYRGKVEKLGRDSLRLSLMERETVDIELPRFHLFQALPQGRKIEEVIHRTVELGVHSLHPFSSSRSAPAGDKGRLGRWERICMEASRTAGRAYLPQMRPVIAWEEMLREISMLGTVLVADERGGAKVGNALAGKESLDVGLVIGPEGGFSDMEKAEIISAGAIPVTLGRHVLRTESAGAVLLTLARHHYGFI
ncbi:MAG: 16S rRNA (uracil(1498)-N(3))-methyltransferase [Candidatus Geothermincolales bacterium]